jgi:hypothetical protein
VASNLAKREKYPTVKLPFLLIPADTFGIIFWDLSHSSPHPSGEKWLFSQGDMKLLYVPSLRSRRIKNFFKIADKLISTCVDFPPGFKLGPCEHVQHARVKTLSSHLRAPIEVDFREGATFKIRPSWVEKYSS